MLPHGNLIACATSMAQVFPLQARRAAAVGPARCPTCTSRLIGLITPLLAGASVVYPVSRQPAVLLRTFRDFRVTMLLIVPAGPALLDSDDRAQGRRGRAGGRPSSGCIGSRRACRAPLQRLLFRPVLSQFGGRLRTLGVGASALDVELGQRWIDMGVDVLQGYGATEMSPVVSFTRPSDNRLGTVGEPIPGVEVRIAEDGEILARGPNRFAGYWQNPEATAAAIDADGWYHTGDLGELSRGRLPHAARPEEGHARHARRPEGLPRGRRGGARDGRAPARRDASSAGPPRARPAASTRCCFSTTRPRPRPSCATPTRGSAPTSRSGAYTLWPDEDFPRTHTLKVKKQRGRSTRAGRRCRASTPAIAPRRPATAPASPDSGDPGSGRSARGLIAQIADLPVAAIQPDGPPVERPEHRLAPAGRAARRDRGGARRVHRRRRPRPGDDGRRARGDWSTRLRGRSATTGHLRLAAASRVRVVGLGFQVAIMRPAGPRSSTESGRPAPSSSTGSRARSCSSRTTASTPTTRSSSADFPSAGAGSCRRPRQPTRSSPTRSAASWRRSSPTPSRSGARAASGTASSCSARGSTAASTSCIYPEGKLTVGGPMQPFKSGIGLIAIEGATPDRADEDPYPSNVQGRRGRLALARRRRGRVRRAAPVRCRRRSSRSHDATRRGGAIAIA